MSPTIGPAAPAAPTPPPRVSGVTVSTRDALITAARSLPAVATRPIPALVAPSLPKPGKIATNFLEAAAEFYAKGCYGLDFGDSRTRGGRRYSSGTDILFALIVDASRFSTMDHSDNASAIEASLALIRGGVDARFPGYPVMSESVAINAITAWTRAVATEGDLLSPTTINAIVMNEAVTPIHTWTRERVQTVVDADLGSVTTLNDNDRRAIANAIVDDSGFEYPDDLSPDAITNAELSNQAARVTQLWNSPDLFVVYGNAVFAFLDSAARQAVNSLPVDQIPHLLWLVGKEIVSGTIKPNTRDVSNAISRRLETLLDPKSDPDGVFAIVAAETGVTVAIPTELPAESATDLKSDLIGALLDMDWQYGATVDEHVAHMRSLLEHLNSIISFMMQKDRLMKAIEDAQHLLAQLQVPDLASHIDAVAAASIRLHTSALVSVATRVANAADVDGMHVPAVEEALRAARFFARLLGPQLKELRVAAATAPAGGGMAGGNGGQGNPGGGATP